MRREYDLKRRLHSLQTLGEAISATKSLAAHHFREARAGVEPARTYREGIERVLHATGATLPAGDGTAGLLVIGGELGLCGGYNAHLVAAAQNARRALGPGPTLCVGQRASTLLGRREVEITRKYPAPTSVRGITDILLRLAEDVLSTYVAERLRSFDIVSCRFGGVGVQETARARLLPLSAARDAPAPAARYVAQDELAAAAVREFLYVTLYDLLLSALACEHGARLLATQSAEKWLKERSEHVRHRLLAAGREASTQEMIEIAAGARARSREPR